MTRRLLTIKAPADATGVPVVSLRSAAEKHGYLIRMGRAVRVSPDKLPELIQLCHNKPREQGSKSDPG